MDLQSLKQDLLKYCENYVKERIQRAQEPIDRARNAANSEMKSSAGDKHETTQAMAHLEQEKNAMQLAEALKLKRALLELKNAKASETVDFGSVVETNKGIYYIALSIGAIKIANKQLFVVAPTSPIALALKGLKKGENTTFNGNTFAITEVY